MACKLYLILEPASALVSQAKLPLTPMGEDFCQSKTARLGVYVPLGVGGRAPLISMDFTQAQVSPSCRTNCRARAIVCLRDFCIFYGCTFFSGTVSSCFSVQIISQYKPFIFLISQSPWTPARRTLFLAGSCYI